MEERWHRSLKASIMGHGYNEWVDVLPTVLLGLRTSFKEDLKSTAAEMVYGTTLRLPGEFFTDVDMLPDPQPFLEKFTQHMLLIRSIPAAYHHKKAAFLHQDLFTCSHVFLRVDAVKKPVCQLAPLLILHANTAWYDGNTVWYTCVFHNFTKNIPKLNQN